MTELDQAIQNAFVSQGKQEDVNKVYLILLRTIFYIPVRKEIDSNNDEPFSPLFTVINGQYYLPSFDTINRLETWAGSCFDQMKYVNLLGTDLISGINENVFLCVNLSTKYYKEFNPDEIKQLKKIITRIQQIKQQNTLEK